MNNLKGRYSPLTERMKLGLKPNVHMAEDWFCGTHALGLVGFGYILMLIRAWPMQILYLVTGKGKTF
jgi:hypothetical protein